MNIFRYFRMLAAGLILCLGLGFGTNAFAATAYSGTFSGGNSGTWSMTISPTGAITGTAVDTTGGSGTFSGQLLNGSFTMSDGTRIFVGTLNLTLDTVSGTWNNSVNGKSGTFTGTATPYALSINKIGTGTGTVTSSATGSTGTSSSIPYTITWHEVSGNCTLYPDRTVAGTLTPTAQANTYTTLLPVNAAATLTVPGSNTLVYSFPDGNGTTTENMQLTFDALSHSITGSSNWTNTNGCMGYMTFSGSWASVNSFVSGISTTLTATPDSGSTFAGWGGACTGTGTCALTIDAAKNVTATFDLTPFTVVTTGVTAGVITAPIATVTVAISPKTADIGQTRSVFITAMMPQSAIGTTLAMTASNASRTLALAAPASSLVLMNLTSTGWQPVVNGQLIPYTTGVLGAQTAAITILNNANTTNLAGSQFCVGYGTSVTEMNTAGRMQLIATVPDPNAASAATDSCILISDARVFAYAEASYPTLFAGTATAGQTTYQGTLYDYRLYSGSQNYLAVDTSGVVFILGPYTNNVVTPFGQVESYRSYITAWEATR